MKSKKDIIELKCANPNCKLVDGRFDVRCKTHIRKYCFMYCMKSHTADKKVAKELAKKNKVYTKKVKSEQKKLHMQALIAEKKEKKDALFKYFASCIIGYKKNSLVANQLKDWMAHINQKPEYIDICKKQMESVGGKISMLVFATFVSSNCSEAKLSGLDKDIKF